MDSAYSAFGNHYVTLCSFPSVIKSWWLKSASQAVAFSLCVLKGEWIYIYTYIHT